MYHTIPEKLCLCGRVKPERENMEVFILIFIYQFPNRKFLKVYELG